MCRSVQDKYWNYISSLSGCHVFPLLFETAMLKRIDFLKLSHVVVLEISEETPRSAQFLGAKP